MSPAISQAADLPQFVERSWSAILDACTRCGKCVEVCPVVPFAPGLAQADPRQIVSGGHAVGGRRDFPYG